METLETLARRIESTEDLQSLVRSMKTLSAVSIRQFERAETSLRLFQDTIDMGLQIVLKLHPVREGVQRMRQTRMILLVFGSDRGLCGGFNENAAELACTHVEREEDAERSIHILAVGSQVAARMMTMGREPDEVMTLPGSVQGLAETCENILIRIDYLRQTEGVEHVGGIFNQRVDGSDIRPRAHVFLPIPIDYLRALSRAPWPSRRLPAYGVDTDRLFSWLIRQHLFARIYQAGLASMASENAMRLASMQNAERNIGEQLESMTGEFRRLRQDAITTELMDIVGGYEILRKER